MDLFFKLKVTIKSFTESFNSKLYQLILSRREFLVVSPLPTTSSLREAGYPRNENSVRVLKSLPLFLLLISCNLVAQDVLMQQKQARLFKTGEELMAQNQFAAARENFNEFLSLSTPPSTQRQNAEYYRAICALNLYHTDAEKQLQDFISNNPSSPKSSIAYTELANFFYTEKNYKNAATYFAKSDFSSLTASQQGEAHFKWGYSLFSQKILKDALDQFNFIKTQGGQYGPAASYYAGFVEYSQADYINALTDLRRAESAASYASVVPYMIANVYYKQKDYNTLIAYAASVNTRNDLANAEEIALLSAEAYWRVKSRRLKKVFCYGLGILHLY
jgi:tetratricopeptide (TPR) repeat protein